MLLPAGYRWIQNLLICCHTAAGQIIAKYQQIKTTSILVFPHHNLFSGKSALYHTILFSIFPTLLVSCKNESTSHFSLPFFSFLTQPSVMKQWLEMLYSSLLQSFLTITSVQFLELIQVGTQHLILARTIGLVLHVIQRQFLLKKSFLMVTISLELLMPTQYVTWSLLRTPFFSLV